MNYFKHMDIAKSYLGTTEIPNKESNEIINRFLSTIGMPPNDEVAWCSAFAKTVLMEAGYNCDKITAAAVSFKSFGTESNLENITYGDIVIFYRKTPQDWQSHVAFFDHIDASTGYLVVLGGNQNNSVCFKMYSTKKLLAVRKIV